MSYLHYLYLFAHYGGLFCFSSSSCVPGVVCFSGLSIFLWHLLPICTGLNIRNVKGIRQFALN